MRARTRSQRDRACRTSAIWPSCRAPIVGTKPTVRPAPRQGVTRVRSASTLRTMSIRSRFDSGACAMLRCDIGGWRRRDKPDRVGGPRTGVLIARLSRRAVVSTLVRLDGRRTDAGVATNAEEPRAALLRGSRNLSRRAPGDLPPALAYAGSRSAGGGARAISGGRARQLEALHPAWKRRHAARLPQCLPASRRAAARGGQRALRDAALPLSPLGLWP